MARNDQLIRQHKVLQILERVRFGKTIHELNDDIIEELGLPSLHNRTLKRDLEALQACLLYTSPSPRDLSTSRMPSSA